MTTNHITSVRIKSVPVLDQDEALDFYSTHLGFEATAAQVRELVTKGALGGLFLTSDDIHATFAALRDAGVEIAEEPVEQPYGTDFGIRDPFGNHIRISQPNEAPNHVIQERYDAAKA